MEYGLDLAREVASGRWRRLLNLIEHLPRNSLFKQALYEDEDIARQMLDQPPGEPTVDIRDWSPLMERLTDVCDLLALQVEMLYAVNADKKKSKPYRVPRPPRPVTSVQRLRRQQEVEDRAKAREFFANFAERAQGITFKVKNS